MYKYLFSAMMVSMSAPTVRADHAGEILAIRETATNYMKSWYQGDAKGMKASLHGKLAKRSLQSGYDTEKELRRTTASDMISFTKSGYGKRLWQKDLNIEVLVLDYHKNIASVKIVTPHYYEYLHLAKTDNHWVIVNALYEKNSPTSGGTSIK